MRIGPKHSLAVTCTRETSCRIMTKLTAFLQKHLLEEIDLDSLASAAATDRFHLCRRFRQRYGLSPIKWVWRTRIYVATQLMAEYPHYSITDIAFACGFSSSAHFCRAFKQLVGCSPRQYRSQVQMEAHPKKVTRSSLADFYSDGTDVISKAMRLALQRQSSEHMTTPLLLPQQTLHV